MPFLARIDDDVVIPEEVADGVAVACLECEEEMVPRGPFADGRARHFAHLNGDKECSNGEQGESATHRKMKSLAISSLRQKFGDLYERCEPEAKLDVSATDTFPDTRWADVLLEFKSKNRFFGKGIIIEVQYKNHSKDTFATTHDYLSLGYSVFWAELSDFEEDQFQFTVAEQAFDDRDDRRGVAVYYASPEEFSTELVASLKWEDPTDDCSHDWKELEETGRSYESCPYCGINRVYDEDHTRFLYDDCELLGPSAEPPESEKSPFGGCDGGDHVWEPLGDEVYRCAHCGARQVETNQFPNQEIVLPFEYMGNDLTELTANPEACDHTWEQQGSEYQCRHCGLIDQMPY